MSNVFFNSLSISFFKSETLTFSEMTVSIKNLVCYKKGIKKSMANKTKLYHNWNIADKHSSVSSLNR